jgi:hypothetical protein
MLLQKLKTTKPARFKKKYNGIDEENQIFCGKKYVCNVVLNKK